MCSILLVVVTMDKTVMPWIFWDPCPTQLWRVLLVALIGIDEGSIPSIYIYKKRDNVTLGLGVISFFFAT